MRNLVVYGSLMDKSELENYNISLEDIELVKVSGYMRVFNQEPSNRIKNSINRAVLNVFEEPSLWFNAIVIKDISDELLTILDEREKGYNCSDFYEDRVTTYKGETLTECCIYLGKVEKVNFDILPNLEYLELCKEAAKSHGEEFYQDFLQTTYKNSQEEGVCLI